MHTCKDEHKDACEKRSVIPRQPVNLLNHFLLFQPFYLGLILDLQESCKKNI